MMNVTSLVVWANQLWKKLHGFNVSSEPLRFLKGRHEDVCIFFHPFNEAWPQIAVSGDWGKAQALERRFMEDAQKTHLVWFHRENGGTSLGMGGPLYNQTPCIPYIVGIYWVTSQEGPHHFPFRLETPRPRPFAG